MKKKFDSLYTQSKDLHKDINNLMKIIMVRYEEEDDDMDVEDMTIILNLSSIAKKSLDLIDITCKRLDDINEKLDKLNEKLDNN